MFRFRFLVMITAIGLASASQAQSDSITLKKAITQLNESLSDKDTTTLKTLITPTVTYGHSNGWIQNNKSLVADLYNGKLVYTAIRQESPEMSFEKNTAWVKAMADVAGTVDGKPFAMRLHILQVWINTGKQGWKLIARQSVKIL